MAQKASDAAMARETVVRGHQENTCALGRRSREEVGQARPPRSEAGNSGRGLSEGPLSSKERFPRYSGLLRGTAGLSRKLAVASERRHSFLASAAPHPEAKPAVTDHARLETSTTAEASSTRAGQGSELDCSAAPPSISANTGSRINQVVPPRKPNRIRSSTAARSSVPTPAGRPTRDPRLNGWATVSRTVVMTRRTGC
jgi:hypothetical protein